MAAKIALFFVSHIFKNCWPKLFFWSVIKTHEILRKKDFFLDLNFVFQKKKTWKSVLAAKKAVFGGNSETAGQNSFFVNDKKLTKFCENSIFFWIWIAYCSKNRVKVGFGYQFWLRKQHFFLHMNFFFRKNKTKVGFGCNKNSFWEEIRKLRAKIIFLVSYKNSWNSRKTAVFQEANMVKIFSQTSRSLFLKQMPHREIFLRKWLQKLHKNLLFYVAW